ncbi:glycoside hydrolase family 16 protein [Hygrophoropsis aurantiaca]|uniref:Glycoside hydrolase family 16 protein n=1 Tax=Hygrophoropsis aurantiaca TaxID=72124 RepID=A0ACB8ANF1_9AGAM|nr:glycoside hydrolase family 16 protein [Hygrophoropsis aurantiaca]
MYTQLAVLAFLLANVAPSNAGLFSRSTHGFNIAAHHAHKVAIKHSAGLARDLRVAFRGVLDVQSPDSPSQNVYCVSSGGGVTVPIPNSNSSSPSATSSAAGSAPTSSGSSSVPSSPWKPIAQYEGQSFFNGWEFFTQADPTHGNVQYVDQDTANSAGLVSINSQGHAVMRVDTTPQVQTNRQSVRITTQQTFTGGLVVMDSVHMPTGCGTWPAFWTNGPNWPAGGEIDIVEGINNYTSNQATIHTNPGCSIPSSNSTILDISGTVVGGTDCSAAQTGNQGCGVRSNTDNSFGSGFNSNGGGVYAMLWDNSGISVYFFPRNAVPTDITDGAPQPSNWSTPMATWPATDCNPFEFFNTHSAIFDTTFCGDWAGSAWSSTGVPGQEVSCAQQTGFSTCEAFVQQSGASFSEAYWEVASVKIYQTS